MWLCVRVCVRVQVVLLKGAYKVMMQQVAEINATDVHPPAQCALRVPSSDIPCATWRDSLTVILQPLPDPGSDWGWYSSHHGHKGLPERCDPAAGEWDDRHILLRSLHDSGQIVRVPLLCSETDMLP